MNYCLINGKRWRLDSSESIASAKAELRRLRKRTARIYLSSFSWEWIEKHGDPDAVDAGRDLHARDWLSPDF